MVTSAVVTGVLLVAFAVFAWPVITPGIVPGAHPDSYDYAYGALALLQGEYVVAWDGPPRLPIYPPGFSVLLMPAVALGGVEASVWVPFLAGLALGVMAAVLAMRLSRPIAAPLAVFLV